MPPKLKNWSREVNSASMKDERSIHSTQIVELSEFQAGAPSGPKIMAGNIGLLHGVKVPLTVVVGQTHTTLGELMALTESSVLKIDREVDWPVDVVVNGHVIARGQLVVVDDHFGVRVSEIAVPLNV